MKRATLILFLFTMLLSLAAAAPAAVATADAVTIGSATVQTTGAVIDVPVYVRDVAGSPLGIDQPPGARIQSFSIKVNYSPAAPVQSITFTRGGITAGLTPAFENSPSAPGTVSLIVVFPEGSALVPFTSNAPAPGNVIGILHVQLAPSTPFGTTIALNVDATLTQLANEGGTIQETVTNGTLQTVNGAINVVAPVPAISSSGLLLLALAVAVIALVTLRARI